MVELDWEDPPEPAPGGFGRKSSVFTDEVQRELKSRPGKWALIIREASSANVSNALGWAKKREEFQVTTRTIPERRHTKTPFAVYARYDPRFTSSD